MAKGSVHMKSWLFAKAFGTLGTTSVIALFVGFAACGEVRESPPGTGSGTGVGTGGGDVWASADAGATWTNQTVGTSAGLLPWSAVASDETGGHLVAAGYGDIWTSTTTGKTWVNLTAGTSASGQRWGAVASNENGDHIVAAGGGSPEGCCSGDLWVH